VPAAAPLPGDAADYAGWYEPIADMPELTRFLVRLLRLSRVQFRDGKMVIRAVRTHQTFVPVAGRLFRYVPKDGPPEPVATVALLSNKRFIAGGPSLMRVPDWLAGTEILLTVLFLLSVASIVLYAPVWLIGGLIKRRRRPAERAMRLYPLLAVLSLIPFEVTSKLRVGDLIQRFGNLTIWSATLFLSTIVFAVATILGAWSAATARPELVRRPVRWFSVIVSLALMIALAYLAYWGVIGLRTWA